VLRRPIETAPFIRTYSRESSKGGVGRFLRVVIGLQIASHELRPVTTNRDKRSGAGLLLPLRIC
jgi:hypothetical protein